MLVKPVGADCNLRCGYCFYLRAAELYPGAERRCMTPEVLETMVAGLVRLRFPQSVFAWQGGEPTLAGVGFFREAIALQQKHGAPGQAVSNALQTNGLLLDEEWCRLFHDYHVLVGLSLDGPADIHDAVRRFPNGRGTWSRVMEAARLMDRCGVEYNILCVVNAGNVDLGADLLRWFVGEGFPFVQFIPCLEPGLKYNVRPDRFARFLCDTFDYWAGEGFGKVSVRDFDALLGYHIGHPTQLCTFGRRCENYVVIEHTGDVYPCDFFVYDEWKLGNVMEAPLESFLQHEKYRRFAAQKHKVPACAGCAWRTLCYGGGQKDRLAAGPVNSRTPLCAAYQTFFAHAVPRLGALARRVRRATPKGPRAS